MDLALRANAGFFGASALATWSAGATPAYPLRDSKPPSAMVPRLKPVEWKNWRRVIARALQSLGSKFMGLMTD